MLVGQHLLDDKLVQPGVYVVMMMMMGGLPIPSQARTNFVKLHRVGNDR